MGGQAVLVIVVGFLLFAIASFFAGRKRKKQLADLDHRPLRDEDAFEQTAERIATRAAGIAATDRANEVIRAQQPVVEAPADAAPLAPPPVAESPPTRSGDTLLELLVGMRLPHGLVPLGELAPRLGTGDRMAVWTDDAPAEVLAPAMADELQRHGYELVAVDETTLLANRDRHTIQLVVHPVGALAMLDEHRLFPFVPSSTAPVVELWVVPG
jgi:hypothetical protein